MLRRLHGEEVGEGRKLLVGVSFRQFVKESYVVSAVSAFVFVDSHAVLAVAVGVVSVVLANADHFHSRIGAEDAVELCACRLKDIGIGQTPLAVVARASLAVYQ